MNSYSFRHKKIILSLFFSTVSIIINADANSEFDYGLTFRSHTDNQDIRTGLNLTPDESFQFPQGFSIDFDLKLHAADASFGHVLRIVSDDVASLDLISNRNAEKFNFVLTEKKDVLSNTEFENLDFQKNEGWFKIKIVIDEDDIRCCVNNVIQEIPHTFKSLKKISINFGKSNHPVFHTTDVPPMTIRNVIVRNLHGKQIRNWKMFSHAKNAVYDELGNHKATVENGIWEVDKHANWQKTMSIPVYSKNPQITYDTIQSRIFIATKDSLLIYNLLDNYVERIPTKKGDFFKSGGSHLIYDPTKDRLVSYSIQHQQFIEYNFSTQEWSSDKTNENLAPIQQHNRFINLATSQLVLFGGYGNHIYKANVSVHPLNTDSGEWKTHNLSDQITPRYLSALGYNGGSKFLILGGYGSSSGKQEESPYNLYDLHEIDYETLTAKKIVDFSVDREPIAFSNSLVVQNNSQNYFALSYNNDRYNTYLRLFQLSGTSGEYVFVGDSIPYRFVDAESFCDLFLLNRTSKLYAIVLQGEETNKFEIEIYTLAYPPMQMTSVIQQSPSDENDRSWVYLYIVGIVVVLVLFILFFLNKRKNDESKYVEQGDKESDGLQVTENTELLLEYNEGEFSSIKPEEVTTKSSIVLLDNFQIFDKNEKDITEKFTPILRNIFLFLLFNSINNRKKITSELFDETFWKGMSKSSASNNRSVNIRKLRVLFENIGDILITNKNSYWYVSLGEDITCDYINTTSALRKIKEDGIIDHNAIREIVRKTMRGLLLPNITIGWLDKFKSEYSNLTIEVLTNATKDKSIQKDTELMMQIANILLMHDSIDEEAIGIKCRILSQMGQKGFAKQCFDKFCSDYKRLLNAHPDFTYDDIFSKKL